MYAHKLESTKTPDIQAAVQSLGDGALTEAALREYIHPLFSRVLERKRAEIYLANHSLGKPLDQTALDVQQAVTLWYEDLDEAWDNWISQIQEFREQVAALIHAANGDCVVPRTSAGQGLRAVLNTYDRKINVVTSRGEFNSIDFILKHYAHRGRLALTMVEPDLRGFYDTDRLVAAITKRTDLIVISSVMFLTGQRLLELADLIRIAHEQGARVLVDLYHAVGALPVDVQALNADFAIGGCYKYLRGGPGAAWLYIHPRHLVKPLQTLDCGWFAQSDPFVFERPSVPCLAKGGNAFLESTPAILPFYQARAGLEFTRAMGVGRLREYSLQQQKLLHALVDDQGIEVFDVPQNCGAFVALPDEDARDNVRRLLEAGVRADAREGFLRLCPGILNSQKELEIAAERLGEIRHSRAVSY